LVFFVGILLLSYRAKENSKMLSYSYYPFKNVLEKIDGSDLLMLKEVSEGWYIDYKRSDIKQDDYAKQLCAFANQYGGWLIIGVEEAQKEQALRVAGVFCGVESTEVDRISLKIREAASSGINPEVLYEEKIVHGPIDEIGLEEGRSIIILGIPASDVTPHIHKSGRVYRRIADQSKPKEETDRFILDELWKKGNQHKRRLHSMLSELPALNQGQENSSFLHVFFYPSSTQNAPAGKLDIHRFREIALNSKEELPGVCAVLDSSYGAVNGFVARQIAENQIDLNGLTLRWWHDGRARLDIPLNKYDKFGLAEVKKFNSNAMAFSDIVSDYTQIVDYSQLVLSLMALANAYIHMLRSLDDKRDIYSCFTLRNVFHTAAFIDSEHYIEQCKEFSVPVILETDISQPTLPDEDSMLFHQYNLRCDDDEPSTTSFKFTLRLIREICSVIGVVGCEQEFLENLPQWALHNKK
jgi:hypothetical protein